VHRRTLARTTLLVLALLLPILSACATGGAPKEIVIGASVPKSGPLAAFGAYTEWAYTTAVNDVNKAGGVTIGGTKVPVKLIIYDDESQPEKVTQNVERLVLKDSAVALLGSFTPPLVLPGAAIAEREKIPMVSGGSPIRAFLGDRASWAYVWDVFFDEADMTTQQLKTMDSVESNKKVALFTDNEQDGVVMGGLWEQNAKAAGYEVVYRANFPVGTTEYGDLIRKAQDAGAEVVIAQMIPPDAIALWKQMQTLGYRPKAAFFEKAAETFDYWKALEPTGQGVMIAGFWHPSLSYPGAKELAARYEAETKAPYGQVMASTYTAAQVLLDAIATAGSVDREAVNKAIAATSKTYVVGPVNFASGPGGHASAIPTFMLQWQKGVREIVYPANLKTADMLYPLPPWSEVK
jgi:branched-chain amino acid transport system substrate-binding protein